jgi:F0F1-type ATP synthase delta subunit
MGKLFLLFNHTLTKEQKEDAIESLFVKEFVVLPDNLQAIWSAIPPYDSNINEILEPIKNFIGHNADSGDFALIQGDFGACYKLVNFCKSIDVTPVYSTNTRVATEELKDGVVRKISEFRHCIYRKY